MICYQVINKYGYPAGRDDGDQAIFEFKPFAEDHIRWLKEEIGLDEKFSIRRIKVTNIEPGGDENGEKSF